MKIPEIIPQLNRLTNFNTRKVHSETREALRGSLYLYTTNLTTLIKLK